MRNLKLSRPPCRKTTSVRKLKMMKISSSRKKDKEEQRTLLDFILAVVGIPKCARTSFLKIKVKKSTLTLVKDTMVVEPNDEEIISIEKEIIPKLPPFMVAV